MTFEQTLEAHGYKIPENKNYSERPFESAVKVGELVFVSGHAARLNGELVHCGIVGDTVNIDQAQDAAVIAFMNCLAAVKNTIGTIENIEQVVNVKGYIASDPKFTNQPEVMNAVSDLINKVFGETGKHSRIAIGAPVLPGGTSVEVELIVQVK